MRLILASQSPRRSQLLREAGYAFEVIPPSEGAECGEPDGDATSDYVARLAIQKAADVAARITQPSLIIACDTVAECDGEILGKPVDREDAWRMLRLLSGREHVVWSGLCLWSTASHEFRVESASSTLLMQPLSSQMIEEYLDTRAWEGKSGAFGYQDNHPWLTLTTGSASNVVGLPMELLREMLPLMSQG